MSNIENTQNSNQDVAVSQLEETSDSTVTASTQTDKVNSAETPDVPDTHTGGDVSEEDESQNIENILGVKWLCSLY